MLHRAGPRAASLNSAALNEAVALGQDLVTAGVVPGIAMLAEWRGRTILEAYFGQEAAGQLDRPVTEATVWPVASVTKPVTAAAIMRLVERGELLLETPVQVLCPEFEGEGKDRVRLWHLLTHTSGLPGTLTARGPFVPPLRFPPGEQFNYSDNGYTIAGIMAERVTGLRFGEIVQREVLDPLDMPDASMYPPEAWWPRIAAITGDTTEGREAAAMFNSTEYRRRGAPAGGLFATARGIVPFLWAFLHQGMASSGRLWLRRETAAAMMRPQVSGIPGRVGTLYEWSAVTWGIGWDVRGSKQPHWSGALTSPQTVSHEGYSGTLVWADPARDLLCVLFTNRTFADRWNLRPSRLGLISDAIVRAVG